MKLHKGQVIKNYKELCKLLGVKPTKGKGRKYHIREFERYCKYHKEGHKFIIDEVYLEPLPEIDGRINNGGNNTKYEDLMDKIIINMLIEYGYMEESFSGMMDLLDFFTVKYVDLSKAGYKAFAETNNLGVGVTLTYHQKLNNIVKKCLETSLNRLNRQGIVEYEKRIKIKDRNLGEKLADTGIEILINKYEQETYKEMDIKHYNRIIMETNRKFKRNVSDKLDILTYWNVYCVDLVDKDTEPVEENPDELKRRLIKSVEGAVKNKKSKDDFGNEFRPYSYEKYQLQIDKLTQLLWRLPDGYTTETDIEILMIGEIKDIENRYKEYEGTETINVDIDDYNDFYFDNEEFCTTTNKNIPF